MAALMKKESKGIFLPTSPLDDVAPTVCPKEGVGVGVVGETLRYSASAERGISRITIGVAPAWDTAYV